MKLTQHGSLNTEGNNKRLAVRVILAFLPVTAMHGRDCIVCRLLPSSYPPSFIQNQRFFDNISLLPKSAPHFLFPFQSHHPSKLQSTPPTLHITLSGNKLLSTGPFSFSSQARDIITAASAVGFLLPLSFSRPRATFIKIL